MDLIAIFWFFFFIPGNCVINEVRVDPCPEAKQDKSCKVKRGRSATIEYDYTPGKRRN